MDGDFSTNIIDVAERKLSKDVLIKALKLYAKNHQNLEKEIKN